MKTYTTPTLTLNFNPDEILKIIYAENAMHLIKNDEIKEAKIITEDDRDMLLVVLINGFFTLVSAIMGYVSSFDVENIDRGDLMLCLNMPMCYDKNNVGNLIMHSQIEIILAYYVLAQFYISQNSDSILYKSYTAKYKNAICSLQAHFAVI